MMLLDTHALIWYLTDDPQLPQEVKAQINKRPLVYVSAAVIWEIAIKGSIGKLELAGRPIDSRQKMDEILAECFSQQFEFLAVSPSHAAQAPFLGSSHKDPFDRMLAAQALQQDLFLVSCDAVFDQFSPDIRRFWTGTPALPDDGQIHPTAKRRHPKVTKEGSGKRSQ
jgi:PIN domain nuclease of toxin-antitoxin system